MAVSRLKPAAPSEGPAVLESPGACLQTVLFSSPTELWSSPDTGCGRRNLLTQALLLLVCLLGLSNVKLLVPFMLCMGGVEMQALTLFSHDAGKRCTRF